ncbi:MAG TPA: hypothetical protein VKK06_04120 [Terriglobia bacterium]|nr:hypothetical protein [Terriglobia bacterium]
MLRAVALALRVLMLRAVALALRVLMLRAIALALRARPGLSQIEINDARAKLGWAALGSFLFQRDQRIHA